MAISQEQVDQWFTQNPNATADDVAKAVQSIGGLEANQGLAGMIANRYSIAEPEVTNYYNQFTAPASGGISNLVTAPADNINTGYVKPSAGATSGAVKNVVEGDNIDTQISQLPVEISHWARSADQRYMELIDDKTGQVLDRRGVGDFSDLDLVKMGLSFVPGAGQILAGVNVADAVRRGDVTGALIGGTGLVPGMENINTALKVGQAVDQGNTLGAITALAGNKDLQNLTGANTANIGGLTTKDAMNTAKLVTAAQTGNIGAITAAAGDLVNSSDLKTAGTAASILQAAASGNINALNAAVKALSGNISPTGTKTSDASDVINTLQNNGLTENIPTGIQLAAANTGTMSDAGDGIFKTSVGGVPTYAESSNASSVTAPFGYRLMSTSEADNRPAGSYYDITANAWFAPSEEVTKLGNLDSIQSDINLFKSGTGDISDIAATTPQTSDDELANLLKYKGINNASQFINSGLTTQDILDLVKLSTPTTTGNKNLNVKTTGGTSTATTTPTTTVGGLTTATTTPNVSTTPTSTTTPTGIPELVVTTTKETPELVITDTRPTTSVTPTVTTTVTPTPTTSVTPTVTVTPTSTTTVTPTATPTATATPTPTVTQTVTPTVTVSPTPTTTVKPTVKSTVSGYTMPQAESIAAAFGIPALANVFYYGKDFGSKKQKLTKEGELQEEEYKPLSVTAPGAVGELVEEQKNKENNANDALDLILGKSGDSMSVDDLLDIVKKG